MKKASFYRFCCILLVLSMFFSHSFSAQATEYHPVDSLTNSVTEAFVGNPSSQELTLPIGTVRIESQAFAGCTNLTCIRIPSSVTFIAEDAFDGLPTTLVIAAPAGSYAASWATEHGFEVDDSIIRLTWAMGCGGTAPVDNYMVLEELNKMSRELIGVECDIQYYTDDQLDMVIRYGERFDIYFTCSWFNNTNRRIAQGLFLDVSDAVKTVTPGMYNAMSKQVWDLAASSNGAVYAIPVKKDYAAMNFITYPSGVAAALGFSIPEKINAWSDLTPFLQAWKRILPEGEYPLLIGGAARGLESSFDFINRTAMIGCTYGTSSVCTVFDDPAIMERYRALADWYSKGLINPDAPRISETAIDTSKPRIDMVQAWPGYDYSPSNGYPTAMTLYAGPNLNVDGVQGAMNALSSTLAYDTERRDAALKYLELCYTNKLFNDTMRYGVKGYHWNYVTAEQNPACAGGVLRTQAGIDCYTPWGFSQPSYFTTSIAVSQDQINGTAKAPVMNQYDLYYEAVRNDGVASALGGFYWDSSAWNAQLSEMAAIKDEYYSDFATGARSIDEVYPEFMAKMNAAGLQEMIADAQAQLNAYLGR